MDSPYARSGYPIFLDLNGQPCVIVGGGEVASRKAADLLEAGACVTVFSLHLTPALQGLADEDRINIRQTAYEPGMLADIRPFLVFAATNSEATNQQVAAEARAIGALINVVDSTVGSSFSSMSMIRRDPLTVAISTGGASPALAAYLREKLETLVGPEYGTLSAWLGDLRPAVRRRIASEQERKALWTAMVNSAALDLLGQGDHASARRIIEDLMAEATRKAATRSDG